MEIKILRNTKSKRIMLVDKKTNMVFASFDKDEKIPVYLNEHHSNDIEDYKPVK